MPERRSKEWHLIPEVATMRGLPSLACLTFFLGVAGKRSRSNSWLKMHLNIFSRCSITLIYSFTGIVASVGNKKDLLLQMYATQLPAKACVRLLNATGPVACAAPANMLSIGQLSLAEEWREFSAGLPPTTRFCGDSALSTASGVC